MEYESRHAHWLTPHELETLQHLIANAIDSDESRPTKLQDIESELASAPIRFSKVPFPAVLQFALGFKNNEIPVKLTTTETQILLQEVGVPIELERKLSKGKNNEGNKD